MKTRLELAHEYAMAHITESLKVDLDFDFNHKLISLDAFSYSDAMLAENEKREQDERTLTKDENGNCIHFHTTFGRGECFDCGAKLEEEWQPDWSVAPDWANWWTFDNASPYWWSDKPEVTICDSWYCNGVWWKCEKAESFNYKGDWKDSLRKRSEGDVND